jgi:hypothetical protein
VHLTPLHKDYDIDSWSDRKIRPGSRWRDEIRKAVERARVAVLLISADFLASDFIRTHELPPLLKAAEEDGSLILPVVVSPCLFLKTPELAQFQAVNDASHPLVSSSLGEQETAFLRVAETILDMVRAESARGSDVRKHGDTSESFVEETTWNKLIKIGDWILDADHVRIIGSGMNAYLLSRREYGETPFVIQTTLEFTNFQPPKENPALGMNAGIIFGWKYEKNEPRYYNILLTGSGVLIERVGFKGDKAHRDFEHKTKLTFLPIQPGKPTDFKVCADVRRIEVFANGQRVLSMGRPPGVVGRVGLRPWRSKMDCTKFMVVEQAEVTPDEPA